MAAKGLVSGENVWAEIDDPGELDGLLDRIERLAREDEPCVVELSLARRGSLGVGLGGRAAILTFEPEDPDAPRLVADDGEPHEGDDWLPFRFRGHPAEFPPSSAVDGALARRAMREFLARGEVPAGVHWRPAHPT
jgi:hypothetical protein